MKEIDNAYTMKAYAMRISVYTIHTNKYIEQVPNKPPTTSMGGKQVWECTCTSCYVREKARTQNFYYENILKTNRAAASISNCISLVCLKN